MKKIINTPETIVKEMCKGFVLANPTLEFVEKYKIVKKKNIDKNKVSLISGGGSGHEPAHAGFVGKGMRLYVVMYLLLHHKYRYIKQLKLQQVIKAHYLSLKTIAVI